MIRKTKIALFTSSLVGIGAAATIPTVLFNTSFVAPARQTIQEASVSARQLSAASFTTLQSQPVQRTGLASAFRVDAAAEALLATTSSALSKTAFNALAIETPEPFNAAKLGLVRGTALEGVQIRVTKLALYDRQSVRYTVSLGGYARSVRVGFTRFAGDNEALLASLAATSETGYTRDQFLSLALADERFDAFRLKVAVPAALDSADVLVRKAAGSSTVTFRSASGSGQLVKEFTDFASQDPEARAAAARTAVERLDSSNLSLYMFGQTYAHNQLFNGALVGMLTPAAVQAVNLTFSKDYGKTFFTYAISEPGAAQVSGRVSVRNFSEDTSREQVLVSHLVRQFAALTSSSLSEEQFTALSLAPGTGWNAATLGVSFAAGLESQQRRVPGNPSATYVEPLLSITSWDGFLFTPRVSVSKSAGTRTLHVRFNLGASDRDQYNFATELQVEFTRFGERAVAERFDELSDALALTTRSSLSRAAFTGTSVDNYLVSSWARLGFGPAEASGLTSLAAPFAANGIVVRVLKLPNSTAVQYELSYAGQGRAFTRTFSVDFTFFAPEGDEVAVGKGVAALQALTTSTRRQYDFAKRWVSVRNGFDEAIIGARRPAALDGLSFTFGKEADVPVVSYVVSNGVYSESFSVTFTSFADTVT